jgi:hypothetical protein
LLRVNSFLLALCDRHSSSSSSSSRITLDCSALPVDYAWGWGLAETSCSQLLLYDAAQARCSCETCSVQPSHYNLAATSVQQPAASQLLLIPWYAGYHC